MNVKSIKIKAKCQEHRGRLRRQVDGSITCPQGHRVPAVGPSQTPKQYRRMKRVEKKAEEPKKGKRG